MWLRGGDGKQVVGFIIFIAIGTLFSEFDLQQILVHSGFFDWIR